MMSDSDTLDELTSQIEKKLNIGYENEKKLKFKKKSKKNIFLFKTQHEKDKFIRMGIIDMELEISSIKLQLSKLQKELNRFRKLNTIQPYC